MGVVLYIMLCGFPPFYDDSTAVLFKQIRKGDYSFPHPYWDEVSDAAKDLVSKVLVVDPTKRYSAQQCLDHPWIRNAGDATAKKLHASHRAFLLIRKLSIFDNIDPACLQDITQKLKVVKFDAGKFVIQAGEVGECMYFVNSGTVQVIVNKAEVDRLSTGDFFGEIALTVSKQRTADVKSFGHVGANGQSEPTELFQLLRTDFEASMVQYPILQTRLAQIGQARVKRAAATDADTTSAASGSSAPKTSTTAAERGADLPIQPADPRASSREAAAKTEAAAKAQVNKVSAEARNLLFQICVFWFPEGGFSSLDEAVAKFDARHVTSLCSHAVQIVSLPIFSLV